MKNQRHVIVAWLAMLILSAGMTCFMTLRVVTGIKTLSWRQTTGRLERAYEERAAGETYYFTHVRYSFRVNGQDYKGNKISYRTYDEGISYAELKQLEGKAIPVFYDPEDPTRSVLARGAGVINYFILMIPLVLLLALLALGMCWLKSENFRKWVASPVSSSHD